MDEGASGAWSGARVIVVTAAAVLCVLGLREMQSVVLPVLLAFLLSLVLMRPFGTLRRWGLPRTLAIGVLVGVAALACFLLVELVSSSVAGFSDALPRYQERFQALVERADALLARLGMDPGDQGRASQVLDGGRLLRLVQSTLNGLLGLVGNLAVVVLIAAFMMAEASAWPAKVRRAFGPPADDARRGAQIADGVYAYMYTKTVVSLVTGVLCGILCAVLDVDFPELWGLVAFAFNYIPNIGSVIAAIPPALLALVDRGAGTCAVLVVGYVAINQAIGNVIEPRLMGRRLGLSPLVVLLSLLFWGWLWGPVGMLLSSPLTMVVRIACEGTRDLRPIAILLGGEEAATDDPSGGGAPPPVGGARPPAL